MKKIAFAGSLLTLALAVGQLPAQGPKTAESKVALVNIGQVFLKYEKALAYKADIEKVLKPYQEQRTKWQADLVGFQKALQDPKTKAEDRPKFEKALVDYKRALEDLEVKMEKSVGKAPEEQIVNLFKDVNNAVKAYAQANGIAIVLAYGEQLEGDPFIFGNITRKMQGMDLGSTTPLFFTPGIDISAGVIDVLNRGYRDAPGTPVSLPK